MAGSARIAAITCAVVVGCTLPANRASGTFAGRAWHGDLISAKYCEYCGGGSEFTLSFSPPVAPNTYAVDGVFIEAPLVMPGMEPRTFSIKPNSPNLRISHGLGSDAPKAVAGELHIETFSETKPLDEHAFLRASFWARFPDGSRVSGRVDGPVDIDPGYE